MPFWAQQVLILKDLSLGSFALQEKSPSGEAGRLAFRIQPANKGKIGQIWPHTDYFNFLNISAK